MWKRKVLKKSAHKVIRKNYLAMVAVCFVIAIIVGSYSISTTAISQYNESRVVQNVKSLSHGKSSSEIIGSIFSNDGKPLKGFLGGMINTAVKPSNPIVKIAEAVKNFFGQIPLAPAMIAAFSVILRFLYYFLIKNPLKVGEKRFFLESRTYEDTRVIRIFYALHQKRLLKIAKTMFLKDLLLVLWDFTIVGGIIKSYSYRMVPYILAENPDISSVQAITLSREMMKGQKWRTFILDLSFIPWNLLTIISFGLVGFFYVNPYISSVKSELFVHLREKAIACKLTYAELLSDKALYLHKAKGFAGTGQEKHQFDLYPGLKPPKERPLKNLHYKTNYSITTLILLFFLFSFIGWIWEVSLHLIREGIFVNRGTLFGPWLPIYGSGGVIALVLLKKLFKNPVTTFFAMITVSAIVEYATSYYLETTRGLKWWDYSGYFLNLNGRVCLEALITFGIGGCACIYLIAPRLDELFEKIPQNVKITICAVLSSLFILDNVYSHFFPNVGKGITDYPSSQSLPKIKDIYNRLI